MAHDAPDRGAPPASFELLVHSLFTQALMALGRIPNPITKQPMKNPAAARHFIDMLGVLDEKTAGNLSTDERRLLDEVQHQLRMQFMLDEEGRGAVPADDTPGIDPP